jgi:hypothetical protein
VGFGVLGEEHEPRHLEVEPVYGPQPHTQLRLELATRAGSRISGTQTARDREYTGGLVDRDEVRVVEDVSHGGAV